eukprot:SAG22_NODE_6801_length_809_cov_2.167606_2_plen_79_part_00
MNPPWFCQLKQEEAKRVAAVAAEASLDAGQVVYTAQAVDDREKILTDKHLPRACQIVCDFTHFVVLLNLLPAPLSDAA